MMPSLLKDQLRSTALLCSSNCRKRLFVFICCSGRWVVHWEQKPHARAHSLTHWHGHTQGQLCLEQGLSAAPVATEDRAEGLWLECCRVPAARKATHLVTIELVRRHRVVKGPVGGKDVLKQGPHGVGKWSTCQGNVLVAPGREDWQLKICAKWLCSC